MRALKIVIVGAGSGKLEALQRVLESSGAHCAVSSGSDSDVIDVQPPWPNEKMILEMSADYSPKYEPISHKQKEPWRKGRPLK